MSSAPDCAIRGTKILLKSPNSWNICASRARPLTTPSRSLNGVGPRCANGSVSLQSVSVQSLPFFVSSPVPEIRESAYGLSLSPFSTIRHAGMSRYVLPTFGDHPTTK